MFIMRMPLLVCLQGEPNFVREWTALLAMAGAIIEPSLESLAPYAAGVSSSSSSSSSSPSALSEAQDLHAVVVANVAPPAAIQTKARKLGVPIVTTRSATLSVCV